MMGDAGTLTIKTARDGPICVLTLSGDLDFLAVTDFLVRAARFVDGHAERLVLDLAGLTFLDCAGARALVIVTHFVPSGCPVIIRSLSPPARQILDLLNLDLSHVRQEPGTSPEHHDTRMQSGASDPARTC
jgi:anti-anti-sigma factor